MSNIFFHHKMGFHMIWPSKTVQGHQVTLQKLMHGSCIPWSSWRAAARWCLRRPDSFIISSKGGFVAGTCDRWQNPPWPHTMTQVHSSEVFGFHFRNGIVTCFSERTAVLIYLNLFDGIDLSKKIPISKHEHNFPSCSFMLSWCVSIYIGTFSPIEFAHLRLQHILWDTVLHTFLGSQGELRTPLLVRPKTCGFKWGNVCLAEPRLMSTPD